MALRIAERRLLPALFLSVVLCLCNLQAEGEITFDLVGPRIDIRVDRAGKSLPISQVPNLMPGDRIWLHPDLPASQSVRYLLIVAFLRGSTNPPPDNWFTRAETWNKAVREEGIFVTVPQEAQQAVVFLAPETGGDFSTLKNSVHNKPGAFVRAVQDLNQASLDRSRLEKYLRVVRATSDSDPKDLHDRTVLLARSLSIKLDQQCFDKPTEQQAPCLTQNTDHLVLDDAPTQSMVASLTSGSTSDLISQLSYAPQAGGGTYSPYVGAVVDMARIMGSLHTAQYQYIPALGIPSAALDDVTGRTEKDQDRLNLRLNTAPSFKNPKSVLVIGLPPVGAVPTPVMRIADPGVPVAPPAVNASGVPAQAGHSEPVAIAARDRAYCVREPSLVLPVEGSPILFASRQAHDFVLRVPGKSGKTVDLPAIPDGARGGYVIDTTGSDAGLLDQISTDGALTGTLRGYWGFDTFDGPKFHLCNARAVKWTIAANEKSALIVGRDDSLHLESPAGPPDETACVKEVVVKDAAGTTMPSSWKVAKANLLEVQIPLKDAKPGPVRVEVVQFGEAQPEAISLNTYSEAGHLEKFAILAGDQSGVLTGTRLDEVTGLDLNGTHFNPAGLTRADQSDELKLSAGNASSTSELKAGDKLRAHISLKDGRVLDLDTTIGQPRPKVTLVSRTVIRPRQDVAAGNGQSGSGPGGNGQGGPPGQAVPPIKLADDNDLPQDSRLSFFLKTVSPASFPRTEKIEVATADNSFDTTLSVADGTLVLQDAQSVLATLDPLKSFGPLAFGPLRFRAVDANGATGEWQPLAKLVRVPVLAGVKCVSVPARQCTLNGSNLFLLEGVSSDAQFVNAVTVPDGFAGSSLTVPQPVNRTLYLKLRDDPDGVNTAVFPAGQQQISQSQ